MGYKTATDGKAIRSLKAILTQDMMTGREFNQEWNRRI
jgi:hypothetical protein